MTNSEKNTARSASHLWSDVKQMVALRRQLIEAEIQADLATAKRYSCLAACGGALLLCGVFVLVVMLAGLLDGWIDRGRVPWATLSLGVATLLGGSVSLLSARNGFRRELHCFRESRAEVQEDLLWLREWLDDQLAEAAHQSRV
jgi:predicted phage tail protein